MSTREAFIKQLRDASDEDLFAMVQNYMRGEDVVAKSSAGHGYDPLEGIRNIEWMQQQRQPCYQQAQPPQQTSSDDRLVTVGYLNAHIDCLVDIVGEESGKNEKRLRADIKGQIEAVTTPLVDRIKGLEDENAYLKTQLTTLRASMSGTNSIKLVEGTARNVRTAR
jgi:hypothetical protein